MESWLSLKNLFSLYSMKDTTLTGPQYQRSGIVTGPRNKLGYQAVCSGVCFFFLLICACPVFQGSYG